MGNKRNRRSKRLATPSPDREVSESRVGSPETGNMTLTNSNLKLKTSGSGIDPSIGVRAFNNENSDSENDDYPLRASKMKDLIHPARPFLQNKSDVDVTIHSDQESDVEDYHMVTAANRELHRQS